MKFKLLDKTKNGHNYQATMNGEVVKRGFIGITDSEEALSTLKNRPKPNEVDILKNKLLSKVKSEVSTRLQATDYKVIRHRDQLDLIAKGNVLETTITNKEYEALLKERNDLRIKSNELEATIKAKRSINTLNEIKIEY